MNDVVFQNASGRYIYWPDRLVSVSQPETSGGPWTRVIKALIHFLNEPLLRPLVPAAFNLPFRKLRDPKVRDESVTQFLLRTTGSKRLGDNLASATAHGIYAGDIDKLSARGWLGRLWTYETTNHGVFDYWSDMMKQPIYRLSYSDIQLVTSVYDGPRQMEQFMSICKNFFKRTYTFKGGMGNLIDALHSTLSLTSNVEIKTEANISKIRKLASGGKMVVS